jgi:hypothetical protein
MFDYIVLLESGRGEMFMFSKSPTTQEHMHIVSRPSELQREIETENK